ncbi:MAG: ABC transporter ATP-binding protein [Rhodovibrionaceae bacterium]
MAEIGAEIGTKARGSVSIENLGKVYGAVEKAGVVALDHCSLAIAPNEFIALVGPSGCGKSTLANILAGFDQPNTGSVSLDGQIIASPSVLAKPGPDRVMVFQHGALFPWMTILDNVLYGATRSAAPHSDDLRASALDLLRRSGGLNRVAARFPGQVSSGMQRRIEIVRALMTDPAILILDEPFRAMDSIAKSRMHNHVLALHESVPKTTVFITHDLQEALLLADRVVVMTTRPGRIKQIVEVDLPRPRTTEVLASEKFLALKAATHQAVHDEALKAFEAGEKERA